MSDPKPLGHSYGADLRIGYHESANELEWPSAAGDEVDHPELDRNCRLIVWDAKGRVILRIDE